MEHEMHREKHEQVPDADLRVVFSLSDEVARVNRTLQHLDWYKEKGYRVNLPVEISRILDREEIPTNDDIAQAVSAEFHLTEYEEEAQALLRQWKSAKNDFLSKLETLGLPVQSEYLVSFTKYGVGGSYHVPNTVEINFDCANAKDPAAIVFHEIIHLTIQTLIQEHHIEHWTKERLVDLVNAKLFPERKELQRDPANAAMIDEIFNRSFPDMKKIIVEVGRLAATVAPKE